MRDFTFIGEFVFSIGELLVFSGETRASVQMGIQLLIEGTYNFLSYTWSLSEPSESPTNLLLGSPKPSESQTKLLSGATKPSENGESFLTTLGLN